MKTKKSRKRAGNKATRRRGYRQYCALAHALDRIGERWTLLIVRECLTGPKRYKDFLQALPGIGTNLLAARLQQMEQDGILRRSRLAPPIDVPVYDLTPFGRGLEPVILALARWGRPLLAAPGRSEHFHPTYALMAMRYRFDSSAAAGVTENYEYRVGKDVFHARIQGGRLETGIGPVPDPAFVLSADRQTFLQFGTGRISLEQALRSGRLHLHGSIDALKRSFAIFPAPADEPGA